MARRKKSMAETLRTLAREFNNLADQAMRLAKEFDSLRRAHVHVRKAAK